MVIRRVSTTTNKVGAIASNVLNMGVTGLTTGAALGGSISSAVTASALAGGATTAGAAAAGASAGAWAGPVGLLAGAAIGGLIGLFTSDEQDENMALKEQAANEQFELQKTGLAIKYNTTVEDIMTKTQNDVLSMVSQYSSAGVSTIGSSMPKLLQINLQRDVIRDRAYQVYLQGLNQAEFNRDYGLVESAVAQNAVNLQTISNNVQQSARLMYDYWNSSSKGAISGR